MSDTTIRYKIVGYKQDNGTEVSSLTWVGEGGLEYKVRELEAKDGYTKFQITIEKEAL